MAFKISNLSAHKPDARAYFLDTNVWLYFLKAQISGKLQPDFQIYAQFFIQLCLVKGKAKPKIIVTSALLSEIVSSYLRGEFRNAFKNTPNADFKRDYKDNPNSSYAKDKNELLRELNAYFANGLVEFRDDSFLKLDPQYLLNNWPSNLDFNDWLYAEFCTEHSLTFVTHDRDFGVQDLDILTVNADLLKLK